VATTSAVDLRDLIEAKVRGEVLSQDQIQDFVGAAVSGGSDEQLAALLMAILLQGMERSERVAYVDAMMHSGETLSWSVDRPSIDKHSTGGVGDKVSLVWGPLMVAAGCAVPMISGRGLGHTGGTLDKLEAIPGYRCDLSRQEMTRALQDIGIFITGQTATLVPSDRRLYDLRSRTGTVRSIDHITASILSKKLAEGTEHLVLDVKMGRAAFLPDPQRTRALAESLVGIGQDMGCKVSALLTDMDHPLGWSAGNGLEVEESIDALRGEGPEDLRELVLALGVESLTLCGLVSPDAKGAQQARERLAGLLDDGSALEVFRAMVQTQGGDPACLDDRDALRQIRPCGSPAGGPLAQVHPVLAARSGIVTDVDAWGVGMAALAMGAGRGPRGEAPLVGTGVRWTVRPGQAVQAGQEIAWIHHGDQGLDQACAHLESAIPIGDEAPAPTSLVRDRVG